MMASSMDVVKITKTYSTFAEEQVSKSDKEKSKMAVVDFGADKICTKKFWRGVLAEFFGMVLFVLCVTTVATSWGNDNVKNISANNVEIGLGVGLAIASLAQALGHVSGGHLNPAVTFGMMVGRRINILQGFFYIIAQTVGGIIGAGLTYGCTPEKVRGTLGVTSLNEQLAVEQGFGIELLFTFLLVFLIFSITEGKKNVEPYGTTLGIGIVIVVCHVCAIPYTGCGINPARSFGPALIMNSWKDHWVYWIGPLVGGALAAILYDLLFYFEDESDKEKKPEEVQLTKQINIAEA